MFELPEFTTLARQMNDALRGKTIRSGELGNRPHKFVWYNRSHDEFARLTAGTTVGEAYAKGKWLFVPLETGYVLVLGECGGKVLYHPAGTETPEQYHLFLRFEDGAALSVTTQMWGGMELYAAGEEYSGKYVRGMRTTPVEPGFTFDYFDALVDEVLKGPKRSAKGLLTQEGFVPGVGNASAQDILFRARLHPRHPLTALSAEQRRTLYDTIVDTVNEIIARGGRYDEFDLYNQRGGYVRLMDSAAVGRPCPKCGGEVEKMQYLGGACYVCPHCQQ